MKRRAGWALASIISIGSVGSAIAADMAVKAQPSAPLPPACVWCGFYVGGNAGGSWQKNAAFGAVPPIVASASPEKSGFIGGGQAGDNRK
jgi:outer membrane immunogenic protein